MSQYDKRVTLRGESGICKRSEQMAREVVRRRDEVSRSGKMIIDENIPAKLINQNYAHVKKTASRKIGSQFFFLYFATLFALIPLIKVFQGSYGIFF